MSVFSFTLTICYHGKENTATVNVKVYLQRMERKRYNFKLLTSCDLWILRTDNRRQKYLALNTPLACLERFRSQVGVRVTDLSPLIPWNRNEAQQKKNRLVGVPFLKEKGIEKAEMQRPTHCCPQPLTICLRQNGKSPHFSIVFPPTKTVKSFDMSPNDYTSNTRNNLCNLVHFYSK